MELKPDNIVKALECHASGKIDNCIHCPYENIDLKYDETCAQRMLGDAILLIKELTEENERLRGFNSAKCEDCAGCTSWKCDCANIEAQAKADTVRKMQDRLIAEFRKDDRMNYYLRMTLDQIAKEMVDGEKDNV